MTEEKTATKKATPANDERIPLYERLFETTGRRKKNGLGVLWDGFKMYRWRLLFAQFMYLIKNSPQWVLPIITSEIINVASESASDHSYTLLLRYSLLLVLVLVQNIPTHMLYARLSNTVLRDFSAGFRCAIVRKLQQLSLTYHKQMESGKLQSKFLRDIESVNGLASTILMTLVPAVIGVVVAVGISLYYSVGMTIFFVVIVPMNIILTRLFWKPIAKQSRQYRVVNETVSASFTSMLKMLTITKAHGLEKREVSEFDNGVSELTTIGLRVDGTIAFFGSCSWVMSNLLTLLCLIVCSVLALKGQIRVGDIVLYQSLFSQINGHVSTLVNIFPTLVSGMEAVSSIEEVMSSDDVEREGGYHLKNIRGQIDFDHVSYAYPDAPDAKVIDDVDLHVQPGECIAFVGSSGSGKTTMVNMIIGFLRATEGEVRIDGQNINDIRIHNYRHHISVVPQNSILFPGTIRENITYGLEQYSEEDLQRAVEMANINEFLPQLPKGLDTQVGEEGDKLSGGQRQRITIARALIRDPAILILDEATSALDNVSEYHVQKAIESLVHGRTTFIVAHRLSTIRNADRIVVMDGGHIVECGTYQELMDRKGRFFELKSLSDIAVKAVEGEGYLTYS